MPEQSLHIESDDWSNFLRKIKSAHSNIDSRPLFNMYERRFLSYMNKLFDTEGAEGGSKWKELSANYIQWKGHDTIGYLSGAMRAALTGGSGYYSRITKTKLEIGQRPGSVPYTPFFHNVRPIDFSSRELKLWREMAEQYYAHVVSNAINPHASTKSIRLPDGQLLTVDRDGKVRVRNRGGQFVNRAASKLGLQSIGME